MCANTAQVTSHPPSKEVVLDAAQRLIYQHGYGGLSMRELAKHSGLAKGTIYHHFQDKRDIFLSVLEREFALVHQALDAAAATPGDWRTRLRAIVDAYFGISTARGLVIMTALRETGDFEEQICTLIRNQRESLLEPVRTVLREGMACGEVRDLNLEMTAMSLFGMLQLFAAHQVLLADVQFETSVSDHVLDTFVNGIAQPASGLLPTDAAPPAAAN